NRMDSSRSSVDKTIIRTSWSLNAASSTNDIGQILFRLGRYRRRVSVSGAQGLRREFLEHRVGPPHLAQRLRMAARGQLQQLVVLGGLCPLAEQLPVQRHPGGG